MAMITDTEYILQAIRLSSLRVSDDPLTPRIISLDPGFSLNPYINASGLSDTDRWPEIKRALDSPPPDQGRFSDDGDGVGGNGGFTRYPRSSRERSETTGGLKYTQTIMGGKSGGIGMRVSGRQGLDQGGGGNGLGAGGNRRLRHQRTSSTSSAGLESTPKSPLSPIDGNPSSQSRPRPSLDDGFFSPAGRRPRADSAPMPLLLSPPTLLSTALMGTSVITTGRGMGLHANVLSGVEGAGGGLLERAMSVSENSGGDVYDEDDDEMREPRQLGVEGGYEAEGSSSMGLAQSGRPSDGDGGMNDEIIDEGSDVEEDDDGDGDDGEIVNGDRPSRRVLDKRKIQVVSEDDRRSSLDTMPGEQVEELDFAPIVISPNRFTTNTKSALTSLLNQHIPHLVSTAPPSSFSTNMSTTPNPFASLYTTVQAPPTVPSQVLQLYFPHSKTPTKGLTAKVRKDATVEEVIGFGLFKYWEEGWEPKLSEESNEQKLSAVGWGLRMVEDDGEVDEDFPPLDRDSQVSKFSDSQFAIVEATESQVRQNITKAPMIQRRPSRVIAAPQASRPSTRGKPNIPPPGQPSSSFSMMTTSEQIVPSSQAGGGGIGAGTGTGPGSMMKSAGGLSSSMSATVMLRVRVSASADQHFTTTVNVPSDMYIADLTEELVRKKRLQNPPTEWVLCLADLTLALPLDRTVASLEGKHELALVKRQWAAEHGLNTGDRRGGDPSASIFKRVSEPAPHLKYGAGLADFSQAYKKYTVQRKIAIGRHERVLAIDGDYIHIMPSDNRAFFDSMKTTSFHITLVASCNLTGRGGGFKIVVWREGGQKRYEFEAENGKQASEIVTSIRNLMKLYHPERNSIVPPPKPAAGRR